MKKIVLIGAFLGLFLLGNSVIAAPGGHGGSGHHGGGGMHHAAPAGHHGGMRPAGGMHHAAPVGHPGVRPAGMPPVAVHHRPPMHPGYMPPPPPRHAIYVGSRVIHRPRYYRECIRRFGYYDPYYCAMYFGPNIGISVAF